MHFKDSIASLRSFVDEILDVLVLPDTEDFCPTVDGLEDVTVEPVLEPPLSVGVLFRRPHRLASARGVFLVKDVDLSPKFGVWTAPCRVGDAKLVTFGSFARDAESCCESFWATKGGKYRSGTFPDLLILGCSCVEGEAVTMLVAPRRGFRLGSRGTRAQRLKLGLVGWAVLPVRRHPMPCH